jgi:acyl dehydratase
MPRALIVYRHWYALFPCVACFGDTVGLANEEADLAQELYFEDLHAGRRFNSDRSYKVTAAEIKEFAERYDPQPFHLDEAAGESSFFNGLAASGWLTAAIVMRLRVQSITVAGGMIGAGVEEMRWTEAVRPGDSLRTEAEILNVRPSASRPKYGVVRSRTTVFNQRGEVVMRSVVNFLAPLREKHEWPQTH